MQQLLNEISLRHKSSVTPFSLSLFFNCWGGGMWREKEKTLNELSNLKIVALKGVNFSELLTECFSFTNITCCEPN